MSHRWFAHQVVSALIHSATYGVMYSIFRSLGLYSSIVVGLVVLGVAYLIYRMFSRGRG